ncbi:hypothetical protein ACPOL_3031 [Acidisarcina polymorpha]|uniref:Uncharacterized protein n=1 Tax=Acidisarcina polymorpha TaxID=2211140 RepID=A0A2Z5FZI6_9BACT|nr:hypothetical protein ACPOL_3031 [Acidisarcina polymorpha]
MLPGLGSPGSRQEDVPPSCTFPLSSLRDEDEKPLFRQ